MRGVCALLSGQWVPKEPKRCRMTRIAGGAEDSELRREPSSTPGEICVSRDGGNIAAHGSQALETPRYNCSNGCSGERLLRWPRMR